MGRNRIEAKEEFELCQPLGQMREGITDRGDRPIKVKTEERRYAQGSWVGKSGREEGEWQESGGAVDRKVPSYLNEI